MSSPEIGALQRPKATGRPEEGGAHRFFSSSSRNSIEASGCFGGPSTVPPGLGPGPHLTEKPSNALQCPPIPPSFQLPRCHGPEDDPPAHSGAIGS